VDGRRSSVDRCDDADEVSNAASGEGCLPRLHLVEWRTAGRPGDDDEAAPRRVKHGFVEGSNVDARLRRIDDARDTSQVEKASFGGIGDLGGLVRRSTPDPD